MVIKTHTHKETMNETKHYKENRSLNVHQRTNTGEHIDENGKEQMVEV